MALLFFGGGGGCLLVGFGFVVSYTSSLNGGPERSANSCNSVLGTQKTCVMSLILRDNRQKAKDHNVMLSLLSVTKWNSTEPQNYSSSKRFRSYL